MGQYTSRSLVWEWLNSLWIILSFIFFSWIGFFFIGVKAKKKMWVNIGVAFLLVFILMVTLQSYFEKIGIWNVILGIYFLGGIVLTLIFRKEYLIRLEMLQECNINQIEYDDFRERITKEFAEKGISFKDSHSERTETYETIVQKEVSENENSNELENSNLENYVPIDINSCSIETLSELPGITIIIAKKAINYRNENNGFTSVEEFYRVIDLKPHFIAQIDNRLTCNKPVDGTHSADNSQVGRSLDL